MVKDYKDRCANCAYLVAYNGEWVCECFGKRCKDIEYCENVEDEENNDENL